MKIRLQIGVAGVFTVLAVILVGTVVAILYFGNREIALNTAHDQMIKARERSVDNMLITIKDAVQDVSSAASFIGQFPEKAQSFDGLNVLNALANKREHYYGIFFGMQASGAFYQNIFLPEGLNTFGPKATPVPDKTKRVLRLTNSYPDGRREAYFWSKQTGEPQFFYEQPTTYDPRGRPWYKGAMETSKVYFTLPYIFESTGDPGITFAKNIVDAVGTSIGVAGIDMTLSTFATILNETRIGEDGVVFVLDHADELFFYSGKRSEGSRSHFPTTRSEASLEIQSKIVKTAILNWQTDGETFFRFKSPDTGENYIASVAPIPEIIGISPILGLAVPESEFVGEIKQTTIRVLQISGLILLISIGFTVLIARLLSFSLRQVAEEARRISNFQLTDDLPLGSKIKEVFELESAISSMKTGLASFGAYVPQDLVRSIVSKGEMAGVGGISREVTLLFSDLQDFTSRTENLNPEELMPALSHYFETMEIEIAATGGNVDKYIGDAIMAMWNAPVKDTKHTENACRAALACLQAEDNINNNGSSPLLPLHTRIGLHTGQVIVGNVGSLSRMQYTALGAVVNLASRIENLNKLYGTQILVSEDVVSQVPDIFLFSELDIVSPAGTSKPIKIFELLGNASETSEFFPNSEKLREAKNWAFCYALYRARSWNKALVALEAHRGTASNRIVVDTFIARCRTFIATPPSINWDGVYNMKIK